jgi:hypothetical protein
MALLRNLSNPLDAATELAPAALDTWGGIALDRTGTSEATRRTMRAMGRHDRETAEVDAIDAARPLGVTKLRDEPKSIHSPSPPARVRWEAPVKRGTGPRKQFAQT